MAEEAEEARHRHQVHAREKKAKRVCSHEPEQKFYIRDTLGSDKVL